MYNNENVDLVSIIIPVYNVEDFVEQCIDSILNQTYSNLEIIAVNDGSTDSSLKILENIKKKDSRVMIINQKNSGVSSARNAGIAKANGKYLVFVDADDFLARNFVDYMLELIKYNDSDFAYSVKNYWTNEEKQEKKQYIRKIDSSMSVGILLSPDVTVGCWNKIYKKEFLEKNNLKFLSDLYYGEGLNFIIRTSLKSNKITIGNKKVYFYRKNNMQSATTKYLIDKFYNGEKSLKLIGEQIDLKNDFVKSMYILHLSTFYLGAIVKMIEFDQKKFYEKDYKRWKSAIKNNLKSLMFNKNVSLYRKTMLLVGSCFPSIISKMNIHRNKKIIKESVK